MSASIRGVIRYDSKFLLSEPISDDVGYPIRYIDYDSNGAREQRKVITMRLVKRKRRQKSVVPDLFGVIGNSIMTVGYNTYGRNRGRSSKSSKNYQTKEG